MKMIHSDIVETFGHLVTSLRASHPSMAYIHVVEARIAGVADVVPTDEESIDFLYDIWTKGRPEARVLLAGGFTAANGRTTSDEKRNAVIVYGRHFISNPDLPARIKYNIPFVPYDRKT